MGMLLVIPSCWRPGGGGTGARGGGEGRRRTAIGLCTRAPIATTPSVPPLRTQRARLPLVSLGLWQNFGHDRPLETSRAILRRAFDLGITHFDLANNYGPPYGSAETNFGRIFAEDFAPYRDELVISTKAG